MGQWHDPNDLVKEGSSSDSESQSSSKESSSKSESDYEYASDYSSDKEDITTEGLFKPRKGFNYPVLDQLDLLLSQTRNMNELFLESINITRDTIPAEVWAKSQAEFLSPESNMYRHLDEMRNNLGSAEEVLSYIHYRAAARAYDICQVTNNKENIPMMQQIFTDNVKAIMDSLEK